MGAWEAPRGGVVKPGEGAPRGGPSREGPTRADAVRRHKAFKLPPLSFPRGGPPRRNRVRKPPCTGEYAPRVEGSNRQSTPEGGYWREGSPQRPGCWIVAEWPAIHRPKKGACWPEQAGLQTPPEPAIWAPTFAGLIPIGAVERFAKPMVGELTRVDIACRHRGTMRASKRPPKIIKSRAESTSRPAPEGATGRSAWRKDPAEAAHSRD